MSLYLSSLFSMPCCSTSTMPLLLPFVASCCNATNGREYHYVFFFPLVHLFFLPLPLISYFFSFWLENSATWNGIMHWGFFSQVLKEEYEIILYGSNQRPETSGCNRKSLLVWTMKSPRKKKSLLCWETKALEAILEFAKKLSNVQLSGWTKNKTPFQEVRYWNLLWWSWAPVIQSTISHFHHATNGNSSSTSLM